MDTDFVPVGEARLNLILSAVVAEGDAMESGGLEVKSELDLTKRGVGIARVAKFILGMANRSPEVARAFFQGYGVMVVGAEKGQALGVPKGVESHQLSDRLRPYLGPDGPKWDLARLPVSENREVLFILVDPPVQGQPAWPCRKDYQPDNETDQKAALTDGDIYVRDKSQTRRAKSHEVDALFARARSSEPHLAATLAVEGPALRVVELDRLRAAHHDRAVAEYRASRESEKKSSNFGVPTLDLRPSLLALGIAPQLGVEEQVREFERRLDREWSKCMEVLIASTAPPVVFRVDNPLEVFLSNPQVIVTILGARALDWEDPTLVDQDDVLPPVEVRRSPLDINQGLFRTIRPVGRRPELEWENTPEGNVRVTLSPEALRPQSTWSSDEDELVITAVEPDVEELAVQWSLTAEGIGKRLTGTCKLAMRAESAASLLGRLHELRRSHD